MYWSLHLAQQLQRRAEQVGVDRFRLARDEENKVLGEATRLFQSGTPAHDPKVRGLASRARDLSHFMMGEDRQLRARMRRLNNEGYLRQGEVGPYTDPAVVRYLELALSS
jgi:hypothetical protein